MWVYHDAEAPMISAMCRSLGITQAIDEMVEWDESQCKLSPGLRVEAMIINILMGRKPLYRLHEFFEDTDVSKIFGPGIEADDLTDDAMARALDKLADIGPAKVYGAVALAAASREGVDLSVLHADTTSVSVQGAYEDDAGEDVLRITWGYSKQRRPDLKQFLFGIGSTKDQIPVVGEVLDGNTSDHEWARDLLCRLSSTFKEDVIYVADSSLVSKINLDAIAEKKVRFISRIPASFLIEGDLKERAWEEGSWEAVGALSERKDASLYKVCSFKEELDGRRYRFVVVHSSKLDKRKENAVERALSRMEEELAKASLELSKREYYCEPDAREGLERFLREHASPLFRHECEVVECSRALKQSRRGRPPKDHVAPVHTYYSVRVTYRRDEDAINEKKAKESCFVLLTNIDDEERFPDREILRLYKDQQLVEQHFSFIKDPKVVGPVYLKKPARVNALAYVFLLALLVYAFIQFRVRRNLKGEREPLTVSGKVKTFSPTGRRVLQLFERMKVIRYENGRRRIPDNVRVPERVLKYLGLPVEIYLRHLPP